MSTKKFSDNPAFKQMLDYKKQDILQRTNDGIQETKQFQRLLSLLIECRKKNHENDFRLILISKDDLANLCEDADSKVHELFHHSVFLINRTVYVDSNLTIENYNNDPFPEGSNRTRRYIASLASNDLIAFHVAPNSTVNYFIDGKDFGDGIFYTLEAQNHYEELKTINQLEEVLDGYRNNLTHQDTYLKFFVPKSGLRAFHSLSKSSEDKDIFVSDKKHLLNNKPELLFHEDIRNYIKGHMKVFVYREVVLENLERLDIELMDEGGNDLYFIEIKWVGESIGPQGDSIGTSYNASPRINPDAVKQVLNYIRELLNENKNFKIGYLAVFDARKNDLPDTGEGISENDVPKDLIEYFPRFIKLPDFRVKNINPR